MFSRLYSNISHQIPTRLNDLIYSINTLLTLLSIFIVTKKHQEKHVRDKITDDISQLYLLHLNKISWTHLSLIAQIMMRVHIETHVR